MLTLKRNTRLDADVKTHQPEIAQGSVTAIESISLATFWGRLSTKGNRYLLYRLFLCIRDQYLPSAFATCISIRFRSWVREIWGYLNTLSSKSLDIPFLNCSILPESSFTSDLFRPSTNVITSAVHFYLRSSYRGRSARLARASISTAGVRRFVLYTLVWTIFIPLISTFREIWFYPYHISCHISSVPVNE